MVERCPDKTEVEGPIPSTRTRLLGPFTIMKNDTKGAWWKPGVIIFSKVSAYIAFPVIIASYIGKYLDEKYETTNLFFLSLIGISFICTIYLIWGEAKIYKRNLEKEEKEKNLK